MRIHLSRRRAGTAAVAAGTVAALSLGILGSPGARAAEPEPSPYYFTAEELPDLGYPWELSDDPELPSSMADLNSGEPTCAAPTPLAGTDDASPQGYTLPVRIKITNGIMLAGYSPAAAHWKQPVPFMMSMQGLTGWVNARVQLPSMNLLVEPGDVTFCKGGAHIGIKGANTAQYPEWGPLDDPGPWAVYHHSDGSRYNPPPGTFPAYFYSPRADAAPGRRLDLTDVTVKSVSASLTGLGARGELGLETKMTLDARIVRGDGGLVDIPVGISGTFSTAAKGVITTPTANVPWDIGARPGPRSSYLPAKALPGAVEGATTTLGSATPIIDTSRLDALPQGDSRGVATTLYGALYDLDKYGQSVIVDEPWFDLYNAAIFGMIDGSGSFFPPDPGAADVSVDMTIDRIGLPKGVPLGYGFD